MEARFLAFACLFAAPLVSAQEPEDLFQFGADVRLRFESRKNARFDGNNDEALLVRTRARVQWNVYRWARVRFELQHAGVYLSDTIDPDSVPTVFADVLDIHQAYLELSPEIWGVETQMRLGRQKLNLGQQRLIASLEWVNTARVVDGVSVRLGSPERHAVVFSTWTVPVDRNKLNRSWVDSGNRALDSSFHGLYWEDEGVPWLDYDLYYLLRWNGSEDQVHTAGARVRVAHASLEADLELAGQWGEFDGLGHRAWMAHVGGKYQRPQAADLWVAVGYAFGSGDSNSSNSRHGTFDNLYPLNHAYYGYMDYFSLQNLHTTELVVEARPGGVRLRFATHLFWAATREDSWYSASGAEFVQPTAGNDYFVGTEFDLTIGYQISPLRLQAGYGLFVPGSVASDAGAEDVSHFVYVQTFVSLGVPSTL